MSDSQSARLEPVRAGAVGANQRKKRRKGKRVARLDPGAGSFTDQIAAQLRDRIRAGELDPEERNPDARALEPGQRVPSERTLADEYNVAVNTAKAALGRLKAEGLVYTGSSQGIRGTFVADNRPVVWPLHTVEGPGRQDNPDLGYDAWAAAIRTQGFTPKQTINAVVVQRPPLHVARIMGLPEDVTGVALGRLRTRYIENGGHSRAVMSADSWFPLELLQIPGGEILKAERDVVVPGGILASIGRPQRRIRDHHLIRMATGEEVKALRWPQITPVDRLTRVGWDGEGRVVRVMVMVIRGGINEMVSEHEL
jgi:DNA-binding GntR family transcriptional regulator